MHNTCCFGLGYSSSTNSGANLCWALGGGGIICNFTPILPYFQHWGDEPRQRLFSGEQIKRRPKINKKKVFTRNGKLGFPELRWRPKKKVFTRNGTLFLSTDLRSDAHLSQIIGGDADEDHTQIVGGYTVKLLGEYIPPTPNRVSAPLSTNQAWDELNNSSS